VVLVLLLLLIFIKCCPEEALWVIFPDPEELSFFLTADVSTLLLVNS
jgi:hypothetical protein